MQRYVLGFLFGGIDCSNPSVVLIRKNKPDFMAGKLNGVGGKVEPGEKRIHAMTREFMEETGIPTEPDFWHYIGFFKVGTEAEIEVFSATGALEFLNANTIEEEEIEKHTLYRIPDQNPMPNLKTLIPVSFAREIAQRCGAPWGIIDLSPLCK